MIRGIRGLFSLPFLLLSISLIGVGGYIIYTNLTTAWEIVGGEVVSAEVQESMSTQRDESGWEYTARTWRPLVIYKYTYRGREYSGAHQPLYSGDYASAQNFIVTHPPGSDVEVKVNPGYPSESRLKQDFVSENAIGLILIAIGLVFALPSVFGLVFFIKVKQPSSQEGGLGSGELLTTAVPPQSNVVACPSCHRQVVPVKSWFRGKRCPLCGAELG